MSLKKKRKKGKGKLKKKIIKKTSFHKRAHQIKVIKKDHIDFCF